MITGELAVIMHEHSLPAVSRGSYRELRSMDGRHLLRNGSPEVDAPSMLPLATENY